MADRKQFHNIATPDPELVEMLLQAKNRPATNEELREQRISFAFGNAPFASELITKESVRFASEHPKLLP